MKIIPKNYVPHRDIWEKEKVLFQRKKTPLKQPIEGLPK